MNNININGPMYGPRRPSQNLLNAMGRARRPSSDYHYTRTSTPPPPPPPPPMPRPSRPILSGPGAPVTIGEVHQIHGGKTKRHRKNRKSTKKNRKNRRNTRRRN